MVAAMSASRTPIAPRNMRQMSLLWRLLALVVILQVCGISAKDLHNDLTFDDTYDIDSFDESPDAALIADGLQPVAEDDNDGSWLVQSVRRVRRELGRLFGASGEEEHGKAHKHHKKPMHSKEAKHGVAGLKREHKKKTLKSPLKVEQRRLAALNRHKKRNAYNEVEGSGDEGDNILTDEWETRIVVDEPYLSAYASPSSEEFLQLRNDLEAGLSDLFAGDEEYDLKVDLERVESDPNNPFNIVCYLRMELPVPRAYFAEEVRQQLQRHQKLGSHNVVFDERFYFRRVRDGEDGAHYDITTDHEEGYDGADADVDADADGDIPAGPGSYDPRLYANEDYAANDRRRYCDESAYFRCGDGTHILCDFICNQAYDCPDDTDEHQGMCEALGNQESDVEEEEDDLDLEVDNENDNDVEQPNAGEEQPSPNGYEDEDAGNWNPQNPDPYPTAGEADGGYEINTGYSGPAYEVFDCLNNPSGRFQCHDGHVIECARRCDNVPDCPDRSDEHPEECPDLTLNPVEPPTSRPNADGDFPSIYESSGEEEYSPITETSPVFTNTPRNCRGDGADDCPSEEEEEVIDNDFGNVCTSDEFKCDDRCYPNEYRCDHVNHCSDGYDEMNCNYRECSPMEFRCRSGLCINRSKQCDHRPDCPDGDDEDSRCLTSVQVPEDCNSNQFFCDDECHDRSIVCNGRDDCEDRSDEQNCPGTYPFPTYRPPSYPCPENTCPDGRCYSESERCDGRAHCDDGSDERNCNVHTTPAPQLNLKTYPPDQIIKERREVIFRCRDEGMLRAKVRWTRPGGRPLPAGSRDKDGRLEIPNIRVEDSGTYVCEAVGYPRHVSGQQVTVQLTVDRSDPRDDRVSAACSEYQATCMNGECIDKSQICDGTPHCSDGSDEHSCSQGRRCQPNQFMCRNSRCVDRVWRCDGEDDCHDNSDEESCDPEPSGAPCRYDEFQCRSGHCIPKSFQCDDTIDCKDSSDELGCMAPDKIRDPPSSQFLNAGDSLNLTCIGVGTPTPVIVWRLNWGHVPDKCITTSYSGTGTIYCPDMQVGDSGAYSCEIINSKGSKFTTDTMVSVDQPSRPGVCPSGMFNALARRQDECLNCFCFGISKNCASATYFMNAIQPAITSHRVVNVELSPYSNIVINEAPGHNVLNLRHGVQFRALDLGYGGRSSSPYLALPQDFMGNQLKSYGGYIKYDLNYIGNGRPSSLSDVIITGNGFTLTYRARNAPQPDVVNHMEVQLVPGGWKKPDGRIATREEIMMILSNVDNVLIRLSYIEATEREVEVTNIMMNSASLHDQGMGPASLVEQCTCPVGYTGDSCESCAPGYVRQPGGPWLGRCVPFAPEPCGAGTYGDPRRGIPCRECPCPQTGSNNFASGCSLGPDNEVTCYCNEGYTGRRCEMCAEGYEGNPLAPGGRCYAVPDGQCNSDGTYSSHGNGTCECKQHVSGEHCDTCKPGSFHLNSFTYTGCIECFCSGLTNNCGSSDWNREQTVATFGRSSAPHGFSLVRDYNSDQPTRVDFAVKESSLSFSQLPTSEPLYWSLPPQFLGNQITSYGGKLNYTLSYNPMPGGLMSRSTSPDVVIRSGEDLTIIHYRRSGVTPSQSNSYSIPIIESAWHRTDGQNVNRQHLLMALSKIDAIYIKATYTTSTKDGSLTHVSMDRATEANTGGARAWEVEVCRCPPGYIGLSCERCAPGFKRDIEAGLYLGLCEPCQCNGHSDQCDPESGVCIGCGDNTEGDSCERCAYGYDGDATGGTPYDCQPGSDDQKRPTPPPYNNQTCYHCNTDGTASCYNDYCYCKPNVQGSRCDQCRPGTFGLSASNPEGCDECFCSHKSTTCRSAALYRQLIPIDFLSTPPLLTDEDGLVVDTENLYHDIARNDFTYTQKSFTNKFWSLRGSVLGNQLFAYGGVLSYQLSIDSYGHYQAGHDVVLIGNGIKLVWSRPPHEQDNILYSIRLHEDESWQSLKRGVLQKATREDFMTVLSSLEYILIRATPKIPTTRTAISDIVLESALEMPQPGASQAIDIEICTCPRGYEGSSCESCAPMHYRDAAGNCQECPCQDDTSTSCRLDDRGYVTCQCRSGYTGDRCQNPDYGDRPQPDPTPFPDDDYRTTIRVSISQPDISIIPVGGSITLACNGQLAYNGSPVMVSWYKLDGQMPSGYDQDNGVLHLYNLQTHDSGIYICQARSNQTQKIFEDQISITITETSRRSQPTIVSLAPYYVFTEYERDEINCVVAGNPTPIVTWTRVNGQVSADAHVEGSRLIFEVPRKSDEGSYRCLATNDEGYVEQYTQVQINGAQPTTPRPPRDYIYIDPPSFSGEAGEYVRLSCQPTTSLVLQYEWTKDGYAIYRQSNVLVNGNMLEISNSSPQDSGTYTCIGIDQRGRRNYTSEARVVIEQARDQTSGGGGGIGGSRPVVQRLPEQVRIVQGEDYSLVCEASGSPAPSIRWTKVHEALGDNVHVTGGVLHISHAVPENRGVYLCVAENGAGTDQGSSVIDIEPREPPVIDVDPKEPQVIQVGGQGMLYCRATGIPEPRLTWARVDGQPLSPRHQAQPSEPGYVLINDIILSDAGEYRCTAENVVGKVDSIVSIRVVEPPIIQLEPNEAVLTVTEGDEVKIACAASGSPRPMVRWTKDEPAFTPYGLPSPIEHANEAFLEFYRVSMQDAKSYKCMATNEAGTDERYITLNVKPRRGDAPDDSDVDRQPVRPTQRPWLRPTPSQPNPENIYRNKLGDNVTLHCAVNAYGASWERDDGRPLPTNSVFDRNSLIIYRMNEQNAGKYRCNALDNSGAVVKHHLVELVLIPVPHITLHPNMPIHVNVNDHIVITCNVEGAQPITVSWHTDNNRPLPSSVNIEGKYLRFYSITPAAAGRYYCSASNQYGNATEMAEVIVNRGQTLQPRPSSKRYEVNEGSTVLMSCDVQPTGAPIRGDIRYSWHRENGQPLPLQHEIRNNDLYIHNLRKQDEGRYICESETATARSHPSYADLYVKSVPRPAPYYPSAVPRPTYLPITTTTPRPRDLSLKLDQQYSNLRVGESTEVECYSSDNSYTQVVWERADGVPLPPHIQQIGNRLIINHVTAADAGNYLCKCPTDDGDLYTTSYELHIEANVANLKHPRMQHAAVGSTATLRCDAEDKSRAPNYRWSRQYGQMQMGTDILSESLTLHNVQANDAGTYICTASLNDGDSVDYPTILVVTGAIPHFHQDPISYMSFPTLRDSFVKFNFDITFRPEDGNGLLLFNAQHKGSGDYISLSLNDGYPEFRFDFDGKSMIIRAEDPVELNEWHTIRVNRFRRDGYMQVDEQHPVAFPTLSPSSSLDLAEDLYLGGVPSWDILPQNAIETEAGFKGCISRLTLQDTIVALMKESKLKEGITACKPCSSNPCSNDGICLESQTDMGYTCICQEGWTGRHCAVAGTQCTPGICGTGRCENTDTGMECMCPLNKTGDRCQYIEHLNENSLAFKSNSYAAYKTPRASKLSVKFQVRPNTLADAVLLYAAESRLPSGDYVAVVLRDKHVELLINTGARLKPVVVRSLNPLPVNKWTEIEIARRFGEGILRVGSDPEQKGKAAVATRTLYIKTPMYIGGYDHETVTLNRDVNITRGFDGCISNLHEGQRQLNLIADIQDAANIQSCGEINEIEQNETFDHEQASNQAMQNACSSDPCENGGTCSVVNGEAVCQCPLNFAGKQCQDHISLQFDANFHGDGYVELNRTQFSADVEQRFSFAAMVFSTMSPNGLLLWWGQPKDELYTGQDFMSLAIVDGYVEFMFRMKGMEKTIRNPVARVDDGARHIVLIRRQDNTAILELDHVMTADELSESDSKTISLPGHVFIGGAPNLEMFTGGRFKHHFNGCVRVVEGELSGILDLGRVAVSSVNADQCPAADDDLGGTEPPVV